MNGVAYKLYPGLHTGVNSSRLAWVVGHRALGSFISRLNLANCPTKSGVIRTINPRIKQMKSADRCDISLN